MIKELTKLAQTYGPVIENNEMRQFYMILNNPSFVTMQTPAQHQFNPNYVARNTCCRYIRGQTRQEIYNGKRMPN